MDPLSKKADVVAPTDSLQSIPELRCSISHEPIRIPGITCVGSIYEHSEITRWLLANDTDPLTGLRLPTKHVLGCEPNASPAQIRERANDIRESTKMWAKGIEFTMDRETVQAFVDKLEATRARCADIIKERQKKMELIGLQWIKECANEAYRLEMERQGKESDQPVDFQHLHLNGYYCKDIVFKCAKFDGARLTNCTFINCNFGHCSFVGAHFRGVTFQGCSFQGQGFRMHRATGTFRISGGVYERFDWTQARVYPEAVSIFCEDRGFTGTVLTPSDK